MYVYFQFLHTNPQCTDRMSECGTDKLYTTSDGAFDAATTITTFNVKITDLGKLIMPFPTVTQYF